MKNILISLFMACSICSASAQTKRDIKFTKCAAKDGIFEVKLAQLAVTRATTSDVKMHAQHMIDDHTVANEELRNLAVQKNIQIPSALNPKQQKVYTKFTRLEGKKFDKKYTHCMIHAHKKAVCLFKKESKKGKDADLKAFATAKLPLLKNHLKMWKEACQSIKKA